MHTNTVSFRFVCKNACVCEVFTIQYNHERKTAETCLRHLHIVFNFVFVFASMAKHNSCVLTHKICAEVATTTVRGANVHSDIHWRRKNRAHVHVHTTKKKWIIYFCLGEQKIAYLYLLDVQGLDRGDLPEDRGTYPWKYRKTTVLHNRTYFSKKGNRSATEK